jgi:hypothetical protein
VIYGLFEADPQKTVKLMAFLRIAGVVTMGAGLASAAGSAGGLPPLLVVGIVLFGIGFVLYGFARVVEIVLSADDNVPQEQFEAAVTLDDLEDAFEDPNGDPSDTSPPFPLAFKLGPARYRVTTDFQIVRQK